MSLKRLYFICLGLALLSILIAPSTRYITEDMTTISYGFPVQFVEYYSIDGEEPSRWELFTFHRTSFDIFSWLLSGGGYFIVFGTIKLFRDKRKKDREELNE